MGAESHGLVFAIDVFVGLRCFGLWCIRNSGFPGGWQVRVGSRVGGCSE